MGVDDIPSKSLLDDFPQVLAAVEFVVPLSIHQNVEERLKGVQYGDDVPANYNHFDGQTKPHRPHENCIDDVRQPTNVKNCVDEREFDLEHVENLPLVVCILTVALNELFVHLSAALYVQNRIHNHHNQNRPIVQDVARHDSEKCRLQVVNVMTARKFESIKKFFGILESSNSLSVGIVQA